MAHLWVEIVERINAGEMPPEDEPQPTVSEIAVRHCPARFKDPAKAERRAWRRGLRWLTTG